MANPNNGDNGDLKLENQNTEPVDNTKPKKKATPKIMTIGGKKVSLDLEKLGDDIVESGPSKSKISSINWNTGSKSQQEIVAEKNMLADTINKEIKEQEAVGFLENTGRFVNSLFGNAAASLYDVVGAVLDPADWRLPELGGIGSGINEVFKFLDNHTILGDGENEVGNMITRRAQYVRDMNAIYNQVQTGNSYVDYALNLVSNVGGSLGGMAITSGLTGGAGAAIGLSKKANVLMNAWLMTNGTALSIAEGTHRKVYEETMLTLAPELREQLEQQYNTAYRQAIDEGKSPQQATEMAINAKQKSLHDFAGNNPTFHQKAREAAGKGADISIKATMPSFFLNIATSGLFTRGHYATRNILNKPKKVTGKQMLSEAGQEALEEGVIENLAEDMGVAYGTKGDYTLSDGMKKLLTLETLEQALIGGIVGAGMKGASDLISYKDRKKQYEKQREAIEKWNEIGKATEQPDLLDRVTSVHKSTEEVAELAKQQASLVKQGKTEEAKEIGNRILGVQAFEAFQSGTTESLIENYSKLVSDETMKPEVRQRAKEAIGLIQEMETEYNESSKYLNSSEVFSNRVNNLSLKKLRGELTNEILQKKIEADEVIQTALKTGALKLSGKKNEFIEDPYWNTLSEEVKDIDLDYDLDNIFENPNEDNDFNNSVYETFKNKAVENKPVQDLLELQERLGDVEKLLNENNERYNKATSKETQKSLKNQRFLEEDLRAYHKGWKVGPFKKEGLAAIQGTPEYAKKVNEIISKYEGRIDDNTLNHIKNKFELNNLLVKEQTKKAKEEAVKSAASKQEGNNVSFDEVVQKAEQPKSSSEEKVSTIANKIAKAQPLNEDEKQFASQFQEQINQEVDRINNVESTEEQTQLSNEINTERNSTGTELAVILNDDSLFEESQNEISTKKVEETSSINSQTTENQNPQLTSLISILEQNYKSKPFTARNFSSLAKQLDVERDQLSSLITKLQKKGLVTKDGNKYKYIGDQKVVESKKDLLSDSVKSYLTQFKTTNPLGENTEPTLKINVKTIAFKAKSEEEYENLMNQVTEDVKWFKNNNRYEVTENKNNKGELFSYTIVDKQPTNSNVTTENQEGDDLSFEPNELSDNISDEVKQQLTDLVADYVESLKADNDMVLPTFEEFIRDYIKNVGRNEADKYFKAFVKGWKWNGYPASDYNKAYNNIFRDRKEIGKSLTSIAEMLAPTYTEEKIREEVEEQSKKPTDDRKVTHVDSSNNVRYEPLTFTSDDTKPKLGYSSRKAQPIFYREEVDGQEIVQTDWEYTEDELNKGDLVNSLKLLHPDKYNAGTNLELVVPEGAQLMNMTIPTYDERGIKNGTETYREFYKRKIAENPEFESTQEYEDTLPILVRDSEGDYVAMVHEPAWYHPHKFIGDIAEARSNTRLIRKKAIQKYKKGEVASVVITDKRGGTFNRLPKDQPLQNLSEMNPEAKFGIASVSDGGIIVDGKVFKGKLENAADFLNKNNYRPVDIRRWGTDEEGNPTYMAFPSMLPTLNQSQSTTAYMAIVSYLNGERSDTFRPIIQEIRRITNKKVSYIKDLDDFLKTFLMMGTQRMSSLNPKTIGKFYQNKFSDSTIPYVFTQDGKVVFGISNKPEAVIIDPNEFRNDPDSFEQQLRFLKEEVLPEFRLNVSKNYTGPVIEINETGNVNTVSDNYNNYIKQFAQTNVISTNIGTTESPVYVTRIQPVINYDLTEPVARTEEASTKKLEDNKKKQKISNIVETTTDSELKESIEENKEFNFTGDSIEEKVEDSKKLLQEQTEETEKFVEENLEAKVEGSIIEKNIKQIVEEGQFEGTVIDFVNHIVTNRDTPVAMRNVNKGERILFVKELMKEKFDQKAWTLPAKQSDGSFAEPLSENEFSSVDEWIMFALLHEKAHEYILKNENETIGQYETRINNEALKRLNEEFRDKKSISENEYNKLIKQAENQIKWVNEYLNEDESFEPREITDEEVQELVSDLFKIPGISPRHQYELVDFAFNTLSSKIPFDYGSVVNKQEVFKKVKDTLLSSISDHETLLKETLTKLQSIPSDQKIQKLIDKYNLALSKIELSKNNIDVIVEEAYNKVLKYRGIQEDSDVNSEESDKVSLKEASTIREKNYSKTSLEESGKATSSYRLKTFMAGIPNVSSKTNLTIRGAMGVETFIPYDTAWDVAQGFLADAPLDFDTMIGILDQHKKAHGWIPSLIDKLQNADKQIQKEFVSAMGKHALKMEFVAFSYDRKRESYLLKVFDTNSSAITRKIKDSWYNNLLSSSPLVKIEGNDYVTNVKVAEQLYNEYSSWIDIPKSVTGKFKIQVSNYIKRNQNNIELDIKKDKQLIEHLSEERITKVNNRTYHVGIKDGTLTFSEQPVNVVSKALSEYNTMSNEDKQSAITKVQNWLSKFGIELSEGTVDEIFSKGVYSNGKLLNAYQYFKESAQSQGAIGLLANWLTQVKSGTIGLDITEEDNSPLRQSAIENTLAKLQSKYSEAIVTNNFRDGQKSIYGFTAFKYITDRVNELKNNPETREQLKSLSYSKHSLWLKLLEDESLRDKFQISHLGLTAIKEIGKKVFGDNSITKLSDSDHELVKLGMFMDIKQGSVSTTIGETGIKMRNARFLFPTMSDKSTMTVIKTQALDLFDQDYYRTNKQGEVVVTSDVENVLFDQLVMPELERILNFHQNVKSTNIKNYDEGATQFLVLPHLNNIEIEIEDTKMSLNEFLSMPDTNMKLVMEYATPEIKNELQRYVRSLVENKIKVWEKSGFITNEDGKREVKFLDSSYLNRKTIGNLDPVQFAAYDFVINSMIANSNMFMTIAGDPAMYYKSNSSKSYLDQSKETFVNVGKRLAAMIAPGSKLANSDKEKYKQVFLKDKVSISENMDFLSRLLDNKPFNYDKWNRINSMPEHHENKFAEQKLRKEKEEALSSFLNDYPNSKDYLKIEGTDAQEYTTWQEHLHILEMMGRTPDVVVNITPEEIREAKEMFSSGTSIDKMNNAQKAILKKVLQPIKPVYTGQIYDQDQDAMRMMYIKTSSFPLIPQVTQGLELDKLRLALEALENKGLHVRASYQSGNKVGAVNNPLEIFDNDGNIKKLSVDDLENSSLTLERKDFKIQLDVPYKSLKRDEDTVTLGTQLTKLLFGNGIMDQTGFEYEGKTISGTELEQEYTNTFIELSDVKKRTLYKELGIDLETNQPIDVKKTAKKLQRLLKDEALSRGYSKQDVQGLELEYVYEGNKIVDYKFKMPLWMSTNSNRVESLLNAIVKNRLVKIKLPGNAYVAGSEEGFKVQSGFNNIDKNKIVWTKKWNGKLQPAKYDSKGKLQQTQILAPSKFRDANNNLIDLLAKDDNGNYKYITKTETGFKIKEDKFDENLFSLTSFRTPTSGHVSASQVEIVGFLPQEVGDLMIVPKNLTTQKGLDFDIDKESAYQLSHIEDEDGNFKDLSSVVTLEETRKSLQTAREFLDTLELAFEDFDLTRQELNEIYEDAKARAKLGFKKQASFKFSELKQRSEEFKKDKKELKELLKETTAKVKELEKLEEKLLMNKIIKIHKSVLTNPNKQVQKKINNVLSMDYAKSQADKIDNMINESKDETYFTPLSDEYQKEKMFLGSSGKVGIGAYSLDVTVHSLFEQQKTKGNQLSLLNEKGDDLQITFGKISSDGKLGKTKTIDGNRTIADVLAERQNIATDNEKEQVMGKVNLNEFTLDVDKVLNLLGFDQGEDGDSISFLFLSQPIIKDYVSEMANANANTADFSSDKEEKVIKKLNEKYGVSDTEGDYSPIMTNSKFKKEISAKNKDGNFQGAVLRRFLKLKEYGESIRGIQTTINTDSKGLGKSVAETTEKIDSVISLFSNSKVKNAGSLLGDMVQIDQEINIDYYKKQGYKEFFGYLFKPSTIPGIFTYNTLSTAENLWARHFPYSSSVTTAINKELLPLIAGDSVGKRIERKQMILKEMKKYLNSVVLDNAALIDQSIKEERERLFYDRNEKQSLASYLHKAIKENPKLKGNKLLQRFEFKINKTGEPSTIVFNNTNLGNFDEDYLNNALLELMEVNAKIPNFNNETYTTRKLAQDLINYALLEGGVQEATQFAKFIPLSYLDKMGVVYEFGKLDLNRDFNLFGINPNKVNYWDVSNFAIQFVQHNPNIVPSIDNYFEIDSDKFSKLNSISLTQAKEIFTEKPPVFISGRHEGKTYLWKYNGTRYESIPTRGTIGMNEYVKNYKEQPLTTQSKIEKNPVEEKIEETPEQESLVKSSRYGIQNNDILQTIISISNEEFPYLSKLADVLKPVINPNLQIRVADIDSRGVYNRNTNIITIDKTWSEKASNKELARTILKEVVHSVTDNELLKYTDTQGNLNTSNAPKHIQTLVSLFNETKKKFEAELPDLMKKMEARQALSKNEKRVVYGAYNILEFVEMMMTQPEFQETMSKTKFRTTDKSLLDKFVQFLKESLSAVLGVNFDQDSVTAQAIDSILEIVEEKKEIEQKETKPKKKEGKIDKEFLSGIYSVITNEEEMFQNDYDSLKIVEPSLSDFDGFKNIQEYLSSIIEEEMEIANGQYQFLLANKEKVDKFLNNNKISNYLELLSKLDELNKKENLKDYSEKTVPLDVETEMSVEEKLLEETESMSEMKKYELFPGVYANKEQVEAIDKMVSFINTNSKKPEIFVLEGRAGTGKTTITNKVMSLTKGKSVVGGTVSHQAKKILKRSLKAEAHTIASMIGLKEDRSNPGQFIIDKYFNPNNSPIVNHDVLIIDETSMVSEMMMNKIISFANDYNPTLKIIFMGDNVQLPPVGEDQDSKTFSANTNKSYKAKLVERMRQGEESPIVKLSDILALNVESQNPERRVIENRNSIYNPETNEGIVFTTENEMLGELTKDFTKNPYGTKAIVYHNHKRKQLNKQTRELIYGEAAKNTYNIGEILIGDSTNLEQEVYNSENYIVKSAQYSPTAIKQRFYNPKTNQMENFDFEGHVLEVENEDGDLIEVTVPTEKAKKQIKRGEEAFVKAIRNRTPGTSWKTFWSNKDRYSSLSYGYAITSHKSQGSTYDNAYVFEDDILGNQYANNKVVNQSLYVSVTRPRKKLVMISSKNQKFSKDDKTVMSLDPFEQQVEDLTKIGLLKSKCK